MATKTYDVIYKTSDGSIEALADNGEGSPGNGQAEITNVTLPNDFDPSEYEVKSGALSKIEAPDEREDELKTLASQVIEAAIFELGPPIMRIVAAETSTVQINVAKWLDSTLWALKVIFEADAIGGTNVTDTYRKAAAKAVLDGPSDVSERGSVPRLQRAKEFAALVKDVTAAPTGAYLWIRLPNHAEAGQRTAWSGNAATRGGTSFGTLSSLSGDRLDPDSWSIGSE